MAREIMLFLHTQGVGMSRVVPTLNTYGRHAVFISEVVIRRLSSEPAML